MTGFKQEHPDCYTDVDGIRTRYWAAGGNGPPVVLVHGLGASVEVWRQNLDALSAGHRVYAPDLPGFGHSGMPDSADLSPEFYGRFLRNFLAAVGIERTSLVGHSLGGGIALRFCQDNPKQVDRLILASSAGLGQEISLPLRIASLPFMEYVIMKPTFPVFRLILHRLVFDPASITDEFARVYYGLLFQPGTLRALTGILRAVCTIGGARPGIVEPIRKRLGTITAPTLVLWGRQDRILPVRHGIDAAEKIPGARLHIFEHCGHMPNIEYPEEFNRLLVEFLDEGRGTRGEGRE